MKPRAHSAFLTQRRRPVSTGFRLAIAVLIVLMSPALAGAADLREGVEQLAAAIAKGIPEGKRLRLAVTDFPDLQGVTSDLGRYVSERLTTRLGQNPKFRVIERRRLGQLLAELKLGLSDLVDPAKAKQLGRLAGVEALVVGSLSDLGNVVELDSRIIEIESGDILVTATAAISKDDTVKAMMDRGREAPAQLTPDSAASRAAVTAAAPSAPPRHALYQELAKLRVEIEGVTLRRDGAAVVFVTFVNKTNKPMRVILWGSAGYHDTKTFLYDDVGTNYVLRTASGIGTHYDIRSALESRDLWLTIDPGGRGPVSFEFQSTTRASEKRPAQFSFSSGIAVWDEGGTTTHSVAIQRIEAR